MLLILTTIFQVGYGSFIHLKNIFYWAMDMCCNTSSLCLKRFSKFFVMSIVTEWVYIPKAHNSVNFILSTQQIFIKFLLYTVLLIQVMPYKHCFSYKPRIVEGIAFFDYKFSKLDCPLYIYIFLLVLFLWKTPTNTIYFIHCSISWLVTHNCYKRLFRKYKGE